MSAQKNDGEFDPLGIKKSGNPYMTNQQNFKSLDPKSLINQYLEKMGPMKLHNIQLRIENFKN